MNTLYSTLLLVFLMMTSYFGVYCQNEGNVAKLPVLMSIPPVATLSLAGDSLNFSIKGKGTSQVITPNFAGTTWLNYTSVVEENSTNLISANLTTVDLPAEVIIKLKVGMATGAGYGQKGVSVGTITLSNYPQTIITNIGTCFTGQGANMGHQLNFQWVLHPNYDEDLLKEYNLKDLKVGVTYTISRND